jgi:Eco57I restriction-modification methylase/TaqI-like C-terminal specificity domain
MAKLFSHKLLQENIATLSIPDVETKIAVLQTWVNAIQNESITKKTESECEQAFNMDIFHKVLWYTLYPTEHYTLEAKWWNEMSGQKADATLGWFTTSSIEKNVSLVQVAVEIKDANTPLTKSQRRDGNLSPVQQGFKYKPQYTNCKWVLVTNFVEIRLYKDNQLDYEIWQLTDLVNPENDFQNFKIFWYILNANNLISSIWTQSVTEKMLSAVRIQTEQITKKFYQEYKALRLELINDIRSKNPTVTIDTVLPKAQKIIDRIVFVHFCEDFGLLPEWKLAEVIQYSEQLVWVSIWQILSGFFEAVNSWSQKLWIPNGYNGGLFHEDKELNDLKIGDTICRKFVEIGKYDFQEDLSVNILWHIFEQSISDLEDLRIHILGTEWETWELWESTKSNKRKKDGIFYTPEYIVDYIVKNSLGKYLEEQFEAIEKKHLKNEKQMSDKVYKEKQKLIYGEYKQLLETITVLDPACWSGAFLVNVFDYLLGEHKRVWQELGIWSLFDNESTYKSILQNNIYGVDLNAESVEITKLSLWLQTAEKGKKLADLDKNIKCWNSLIEDRSIAWDKAFDRNKEFASIMNKWWFDVIVWNPPYVRVQHLNHKEIDWYKNNKVTAHKRVDISILFFELAYKILKEKWVVSFITSNQFCNTEYGLKIRNFIKNNFRIREIIDFWDLPIFQDATTYVSIFVFTKDQASDFFYYKCNDLNETNNIQYIPKQLNSIKDIWNDAWVFSNKNAKKLLMKLESFPKISEYTKSRAGLITWLDDVLMLDFDVAKKMKLEEDLLLPIIRWKDPIRYWDWKPSKVVIYPYEYDWNETKLIPFETIQKKYPIIWDYLLKNKSLLEKRKDSRHTFEWKNNWYWLIRFGQKKVFHQIKIITPWEVKNHKFWLDTSNSWFSCARVFSITVNKNVDIKYILAVLNSSVIKFYLQSFASLKNGGYYTYSSSILWKTPLKVLNSKEQKPYIEKVDEMLSLNKQLQEKIDFTIRFIQSKFNIQKPTTKLNNFRELEFSWFVKELNLKKLPIDTEAELMRYFEKEKAEILLLQAQRNDLDKTIDDMVFDLYGLTEAERKVVLES